MDKNKKELIELILDSMKNFETRIDKLLNVFGVEFTGESGIYDIEDIAYKGIPLIVGEEETDYLDNLLCSYISKKMSKKEYFKLLEAYIKEEK